MGCGASSSFSVKLTGEYLVPTPTLPVIPENTEGRQLASEFLNILQRIDLIGGPQFIVPQQVTLLVQAAIAIAPGASMSYGEHGDYSMELLHLYRGYITHLIVEQENPNTELITSFETAFAHAKEHSYGPWVHANGNPGRLAELQGELSTLRRALKAMLPNLNLAKLTDPALRMPKKTSPGREASAPKIEIIAASMYNLNKMNDNAPEGSSSSGDSSSGGCSSLGAAEVNPGPQQAWGGIPIPAISATAPTPNLELVMRDMGFRNKPTASEAEHSGSVVHTVPPEPGDAVADNVPVVAHDQISEPTSDPEDTVWQPQTGLCDLLNYAPGLSDPMCCPPTGVWDSEPPPIPRGEVPMPYASPDMVSADYKMGPGPVPVEQLARQYCQRLLHLWDTSWKGEFDNYLPPVSAQDQFDSSRIPLEDHVAEFLQDPSALVLVITGPHGIPLASVPGPFEQGALLEYVKNITNAQDHSQTMELLVQQHACLLLDGYDELFPAGGVPLSTTYKSTPSLMHNLYALNQLYYSKTKVILTCEEQFLCNLPHSWARLAPVDSTHTPYMAGLRYQSLLPLGPDSVETYVLGLCQASGDSQLAKFLHPLLQIFTNIPRNPLHLAIATQSLPILSQDALQQQQRKLNFGDVSPGVLIYTFIKKGFADKLLELAGQCTHDEADMFERSCWMFVGSLGFEMWVRDLHLISISSHIPAARSAGAPSESWTDAYFSDKDGAPVLLSAAPIAGTLASEGTIDFLFEHRVIRDYAVSFYLAHSLEAYYHANAVPSASEMQCSPLNIKSIAASLII
eukprot:gene6803-1218_t